MSLNGHELKTSSTHANDVSHTTTTLIQTSASSTTVPPTTTTTTTSVDNNQQAQFTKPNDSRQRRAAVGNHQHHNHHQQYKQKNPITNHNHHHHSQHKRRSPVVENKCVKCAKNYVLPVIVTMLGSTALLIGSCLLIPGAYIENTVAFVINELMAFVEVGLMFASYFKCLKTSPGYVSPNWEVEKVSNEEDRLNLLKLEPTKNGEARYCAKCGVYQPPRAHHSRVHNQCVLRMDHYCVWVNNVVGAHNHKFFYLFLLYVCMGIGHYFVTIVFYCIRLAADINMINPILFVVLIMFTVFMLPISLMVFMFFGWNTFLLLTNQTAIENHVNSEINVRLRYKYRKNADKQQVKFRNIYNVRAVDNVKSVLGDQIWLWLLPTDPQGIDGYHFNTIALEEVEKINALVQDARPDESIAYDSSDEEGEEYDEQEDEEQKLFNNRTNEQINAIV